MQSELASLRAKPKSLLASIVGKHRIDVAVADHFDSNPAQRLALSGIKGGRHDPAHQLGRTQDLLAQPTALQNHRLVPCITKQITYVTEFHALHPM